MLENSRKRSQLEPTYEPIADDTHLVPNQSFCPFGENTVTEKCKDIKIGSNLVDGSPTMVGSENPVHEVPGMASYKYMIGAHSTGTLPHTIRNRIQGDEGSPGTPEASSQSPALSRGKGSTIFADALRKSFAYNKRLPSNQTISQSEPGSANQHLTNETCENPYYDLSIPYTEACTGRSKLSDDSFDLSDLWYVLKSPFLHDSLFFGIRVMLVAVFPPFILVQHPATESFFFIGLLIPTLAAAFSAPNLGAQVKVFFMVCQAAIFLLFWGYFMEYVNLMEHRVPWWFCMFLVPFLANLCGDLPSKRLIMVFSVMMMQIQDKIRPTPETHFPAEFAKNMAFGASFALLGAIIPFPIFAYKIANERMSGLHSLYAASLGNAVKGFWAPVLLDAEIACKQIPWMKIRTAGAAVQELMGLANYEIMEDGFKNDCRGKRLKALDRIRWCLYSLSAASSLNNETRKASFGQAQSKEFIETADRIQALSLKLSAEAINVFGALGRAITPEEVLAINFSSLKEETMKMREAVDSERDETLLARKFSKKETNQLLRVFAYHTTLAKLCTEIIAIESWAASYDRSTYPNFFMRFVNFFIADYWRNFWIELPRRMLLSTPRDTRMIKDGIRYSLGLIVVVVFTNAVTVKEEGPHTYYFGMAILARVAQQTASETLQIGLMRICGLAFGSSFGYIITFVTTNVWYSGMFLIVLGFIATSFSRHPIYSQVGQYAMITTVAGVFQSRMSNEYLLSRITANVIAFGLYLIICITIFPVDPVRMTFNYQTQVLKDSSEATQWLTTLGCCPITTQCEEAAYLLKKAEKCVELLRSNLVRGLDWISIATSEPVVRGDSFPADSFNFFILRIAEIASLQEGILESMRALHQTRDRLPSPVIFAIFELIRPFLIDVGKIVQRYFQLLIASCEAPKSWSLEKAASQLWRGQLSLLSLRTVTGNIQRCFITALLPGSSAIFLNPKNLYEEHNKGENVSFDEFSLQGSFSDLMAGVQEAVIEAKVERLYFCVFENIVVRFMLLVSTMTTTLDSAIRIHEYQLSRF